MDFKFPVVFALVCIITVAQGITECYLFTFGKHITCYGQKKVNNVPIFPSYNGTLNYIQFYNTWMLRSLDKNSFKDAPLAERLILQNIGLQHLTCDAFLRFRRDLTVLNLDNNLLDQFPACVINNLAHLETLTMSGNFLTCVPEHSIPGFLQHLDLSDNKIHSLSPSVSTDVYNPSSLKALYINTNQLSRIDENEFFQFAFLEQLDASDNLLEYINPKSFQSSRNNITGINLSRNKLEGNIWQSLVHLQELKTLNLSHNRINHIEKTVMYSLRNLNELDMSFNNLSKVGQVFDSQELHLLALHHNKIVNISSDVFTKNTKFTRFFEVDLAFNNITDLTIDLSACLRCTLKGHHNRLRQLEIISSNDDSSFKMIDISFNNLTNIPALLPPVEIFNGSQNPLSTQSVITFLELVHTRSVQIANFQNIKLLCDKQILIPEIWINSSFNLDLSDNCVPIDFICQLRSDNPYQVSINLDRNMIKTFSYCHLNVSVERLSVKGNLLTNLNQTYFEQELRNLRYLDIAENNISVLPQFTGNRMFYNASQNNVHHPPTTIGCYRYYTYSRVNIFDLSSNYIDTAFTIAIDCHMVGYSFIIDLSNNNFIQNPTFFMYGSLRYSTVLLNFTNNNIEHLALILNQPKATYRFKIITDLSKNNLSLLKNSMTSMCGDCRFDCTLVFNFSYNSVIQFPSCNFTGTECRNFVFDFDFSHNLLQMLPYNETCVIDRVRMLNISYNLLSEISMPIANSSNLQYLALSRNTISSITHNAFLGLPNLRELDLSFNKLQVFPDSLKLISSLRKLNLAGNNILSIPDVRSSIWPFLSYFYFAGNPVICSCSTAWLKNYTLQTDFGYCKYPPESVNNSATCLSTTTCDGKERVYTSKENMKTCSASELILRTKKGVISWEVSPKYTTATSGFQIDVFVVRECKVIANYSSLTLNEIRTPSNITGTNFQMCIKIDDASWVTRIMKCLAVDYSQTKNNTTEQAPTQSNLSGGMPQNVSVGVIASLSVMVLICGGITGIAAFIAKRRGGTKGSASHHTTVQRGGTCNQENVNVYENAVPSETSFSSTAADNYEKLDMTNDKPIYDDI